LTAIGQGDLAADKAEALRLTPVSRETEERLQTFVALLLQWQQTTNLISPATIPNLWTRHVADSLQLIDLAPDAKVWVDFGSGGGFPGIPVACVLAGRPGAGPPGREQRQEGRVSARGDPRHRRAGGSSSQANRGLWGQFRGQDRCGQRQGPGAIANPLRSGVCSDRAGRDRIVSEGPRCSG